MAVGTLAGNLAETLSRAWWALLLRGLVATGFGIAMVMRPGIALGSLLFLFGLFTLADGVLGVFSALANRRDRDNWVMLLIGGLAGVGVGLVTLTNPGFTTVILIYWVAAWALVLGVIQMILAVRLRAAIEGEWTLFGSGLASIALGLFLLFRPVSGALAAIWVIGFFVILIGILLMALAFRMKSFAGRIESRAATGG